MEEPITEDVQLFWSKLIKPMTVKHFESPFVKSFTLEELLYEKGYIIYTSVGFSMLPLLRQKRDIIEIRPLPCPPKKYDVILYKRESTYILHRVLKVLPDGKYLIAGDHNIYIERDVTDSMILGRMTRIFRNGREINIDTNIPYWWYSRLWVDFFPVKCLIIRARRKAARILHNLH